MDKCFNLQPLHFCSGCDHRFKRRDALLRHLKCCRKKQNSHKCVICGAALSRRDHLLRHLKSVHGEDGPPLPQSLELSPERERPKARRPLQPCQYQAHDSVPTVDITLEDDHQEDEFFWTVTPSQLSTEEFVLGDNGYDCEISSNSTTPLQDGETQKKNLKRAKYSTPDKEGSRFDFPKMLTPDNFIRTTRSGQSSRSNIVATNPQLASLLINKNSSSRIKEERYKKPKLEQNNGSGGTLQNATFDKNKNSTRHIKIEKLKQEIKVEDDDADGASQDTRFNKRNSSRNEDNTSVQPSSSREMPIAFETVLCVNNDQVDSLLPEEDPVSPFETVICGNTTQGEQETIEVETNRIRIVHQPSAEFTVSEPARVIKTESESARVIKTEIVNQNATKPHCNGFIKNKEETNSLLSLARLTCSVGTSRQPPAQRNRGTETMEYSISADYSMGAHMVRNSNTATTNSIAATTTNYSNVNPTVTTFDNPPDSNAVHTQSQLPLCVPPPQPSCDEGLKKIFNSLKNIPAERRKKTEDKILSLVKLVRDLNIDPDDVRFSVDVCVQSKGCD